ncbi:methyl-accepting chemotaxis protein [Paraburkholderia mimosarum]|uniref:methyl-accepting chemotaxis protein n=1 Tax=Paraburkholderia mimosarum TaxID=312026 RepID=UPI000429607C|nr:methyl-accepting chemotaxis protein [Paraburkholderia mimosarum]
MRSIKVDLVVVTCVFVLLLFAISFSGLHGLSTISSDLRALDSETFRGLQGFSDMRSAEVDVWLDLRKVDIARSKEDTTAAFGRIRSDLQRLNSAWRSASERMTDEAQRENVARTASYVVQIGELIDRIELASNADEIDTVRSTMKELESVTASLNGSIENNIGHIASQAKATVADGDRTFGVARRYIGMLFVVSVMIGVSVTRYMMRTMLGPLSKAVLIADEIAAGKLGNAIEVTSRNEFGRLLESLGKMDHQLREMVGAIQGASAIVEGTSREIAAGNVDLSARTEEQAASLEQTSANMLQLTETVRHNADNARHANALADDASRSADTGNELVHGMVATIKEISASSDKISEITGTIEGIAFKTNILALNASVEAARAGQLGRGFAVVAAEVRALAQHASAAAKEISQLIGASVALIRTSDEQAADVRETMSAVKQAIKHVSDIVAEIARASDEQSYGIGQVSQALVQMDHVTQRNATLIEQTSAGTQSLTERARALETAVSAFRISTLEHSWQAHVDH